MKKFIYLKAFLGLSLIAILFGSCAKSPEEKIVGSWKFEKVKYTGGIFNSKDVTDQYDHLVLTFSSGGTFTQANTLNNTVEQGNWKIDEQYVSTGNEGTYVQSLILTFPNGSGVDIYVWNDFYISNRTMRGTEGAGNEHYSYRLKRQ